MAGLGRGVVWGESILFNSVDVKEDKIFLVFLLKTSASKWSKCYLSVHTVG